MPIQAAPPPAGHLRAKGALRAEAASRFQTRRSLEPLSSRSETKENGGPHRRPAAVFVRTIGLEVERHTGKQEPTQSVIDLREGVTVAERSVCHLATDNRR